MQRKTISFDDRIYKRIKEIQGEFIESAGDFDDMSFTTAVNMLVLGGLIFAPEGKDERWEAITDFLKEKSFDLNRRSLGDRYTDTLLGKSVKEE